MATKCKSYIDAISTIDYHNEKEDKFYEHDLHLNLFILQVKNQA